MRKEYKIIIGSIYFVVGLLSLGMIFKDYLGQYFYRNPEGELLVEIIVRLFIFILLLIGVKRLGLNLFNGLKRKPFIKNKSVLIVPIILIVAGLIGNWTTYSEADNQLLILFTISVLLVGLVEETWLRGLILPLLIKSHIGRKQVLYVSVLLSAVLFGLLHYVNLFEHPENFWGITSQVLFGIAIGVFFGALMLRTGNVFVVAICHGSINFIFANSILGKDSIKQVMEGYLKNTNFDWVTLLANGLLFCLIIWIGLNMIRRVDQAEIKRELNNLKI